MAKPLETQSREELIEYVKALRIEAQENREEAEVYTRVFHQLGPAEQRGLLHMVQTFVENPKQGAELFADLASSILGNDEVQKTDPTPKEEIIMAEPTDETPAWAQALIASVNDRLGAVEAQLANGASAAEEREIAAYKAQARSFGFEEGTDEWYSFFEIAASGLAGDGDLDKALGIYTKLYGDPKGEPEAEEEAPAEEPAKPAKAFPKTAAAPAVTPAPEAEEPDLTSKGVRAAALDFLTRATADPIEG